MLVIAERINSSREMIAKAMLASDEAFIQREALAQVAAGAHYVDVNTGALEGREADRLKWAVEAVQEVIDAPLCIDSPDPQVIRDVLPLVRVRPVMINSISLEPARLERLLPLVAEYGARVIGLCQSEDSMAVTADVKVELGGRLVEKVTAAGIPIEDLYIDPLVYPLGTGTESALATLDAIERIMREYPGVHTTCGLTNVSYGLPNRRLINRTFLVACVMRGLDSAIMDPTDKQLYGALRTAMMVAGRDEFCMEYIRAFRAGQVE
jgi:cobalamin-dependent methionine synthase I